MMEATLKKRFKRFAIDIVLFGKKILKAQEYYNLKGQCGKKQTNY